MVYAYLIVIWELNESSVKKKFPRVVPVRKYFG
jgi:hypothetical protein